MTCYIYGLWCPVENAIRYVGKAVRPARRLAAHISGARRFAYDHHTARWIRRLLADGLEPGLVVLHEVQEGERWQEIEREFIASAPSKGWHLTNSTAGGEGLDYINPEDEARYRANLKRAMAVVNASPAGKERMRRMAEAALEPEALARRSAAIRASAQRPEFKLIMAKVGREIGSRPEVRAAKSAASTSHWRRPEYREALTAARNDPKFTAEQSARLKGRWQDEAARKKMNDARWTPEKRREQAGRIRAYNQKRQAGTN